MLSRRPIASRALAGLVVLLSEASIVVAAVILALGVAVLVLAIG